VDAFADLNGWADHLVKGAKLQIYDYFRYTPLGAGFLTGGKAGTEDPFLRGIQSFRANTYSNTINTRGFYPVFRDVGIEANYAFSLYRVGSILAATSTGATYFNTMVNEWSAGPRWQFTRTDAMTLYYEQSLINQQISGGGGTPFNTNTQTVAAKYMRTTPSWTLTLVGGGTLIEPASLAFPSGKIALSTSPERSTIFVVDLSRQAAPSFFLTAGALISNVAQLQVTHRLERHLTLRGSVNYGFNESVPKSADTQFTNMTFSAGLNYMMTKTLSFDLFYDHNDFKTRSPSVNYVILRDVIGVALTTQWR
jgi:opacity protein-like surface antigen